LPWQCCQDSPVLCAFADCLDYLIYRLGWAGTGNSGVLSIKERNLSKRHKQWAASRLHHPHVLPQTASYVIISALAVPGFIVESVLSLIGLNSAA